MQTIASPYRAPSPHVRNITKDIVLTLLTCGLFNVYVQHAQIAALNSMLGEPRYSFWQWALLTLLTCGLYFIYHEYRKTRDLAILTGAPGREEIVVNLILTLFGLHIVADAILQSHINRYYGSNAI